MSENAVQPAPKLKRVGSFDLERLSWDDLKLFMAASRAGSFRQSAKATRVSAQTIIRSVERLEALLGVTLLTRVPEGIIPTREGEMICRAVEDMERASATMRLFLDPDMSSRGVVRIAVTDGLGTYWIMPQLASFNRQNPMIIVDLQASMQYSDVLRAKADIALQLTRPTQPDVIARKMGRLHIYPFASRAYVERYGVPSSRADYVKHRIVDQVAPMLEEGAIATMLGLKTLDGVIAMRTSSSVAHYEAVLHGVGIGAIPTYAVARGADLIPLDIGMYYYLDIWMSCHPDARNIPRVRALMSWLESIFDPMKHDWFRDEFIHPSHFKPMISQG